LPPENHLFVHPNISFSRDRDVTTSRLDSILPADSEFDFVNFDIQGAELPALRGLGKRLADVKWAYLEVNTRRLYKDCTLLPELDAFLGEAGFRRIATCMAGPVGWGDALYFNETKFSRVASHLIRMKAKAMMAAIRLIKFAIASKSAARAGYRRMSKGTGR
jgi:hypothetical protein